MDSQRIHYHYFLLDEKEVGTITGILDIVVSLQAADKIIIEKYYADFLISQLTGI